MRWDSPFALSIAATISIHVILVVTADAVEQYTRDPALEAAPHITLVDVELPAPPPPPPPEPLKKQEEPPPKPEVKAPVQQKIVREPTRQEQPPAPDPTPPSPDPDPASGGEQVVQLPDLPSGHGVPVAHGTPHPKIGRGGTGGGTGAGTGSGSADEPKPMSVATIKTRAMPKGDYGYFAAGKDYPPEARQLGIQGPIRVRLVVDEHGKVASTRLLNSLGHGLDELALARAKSIEFDPAKDTDDHAVTSVVVWTFDMRLPE